jgi:polar amino acid transport system substrate-binding protein
VGFELEIADALGKRLGVRARFVQVDWSTLVPALERGDFDVAMNGLEDTPARRDRILVSNAYFVFGETLAVKKGNGARSLDDLRGKRVATLNQSYAFDLLRERGYDPVLYEGVSEPYDDLVLGRVDGVLLDHVIADRYGCNRKTVECLPADVARGRYVIGIRREDGALKASLDASLDAMSSDGELRDILARWKLWYDRQSPPPGAGGGPTGAALPSDPAAPPAPGARPAPATDTVTAVPPVSSEPPVTGGPAPREFTLSQAELFVRGALVTLGLSATSFAIAVPLGLLLALARLRRRGLVRFAAGAYVEVLRGTPLLLQLYVVYFALAPLVRLDAVFAAVLGLSLNYAAYEAEIHRGALQAVPRGQVEAARALGLTPWQALRHVVLPQSMRVALPPMTNDFVALLKDSSLVSVITVVELTKRMTIAAVDLRGWAVPGAASSALYFAMSFPLARLAKRLERRLVRDQHPESP